MEKYNNFASSNGVAIPIIQRDYVQGAEINHVKRDKFLKSLLAALLDDKPYEIDFIYGSSENNGTDTYFQPVDGQQRLTTLALIGWILNQKTDMHYSDAFKLLTYTTRPSTEQFCKALYTYKLPSDYTTISNHIKTEPGWFSQRWLSDPSIIAMLAFLDAADALLSEKPFVDNIDAMAERFFNNSPITFERLDMQAMSLNDDLYIKMNARGKLLTPFENWKAEFEGYLKTHFPDSIYKYNLIPDDPNQPTFLRYFEYAIEHDWCDMLWPLAYSRWEQLSEEERRKVTYPRIDESFMYLLDYLTRFMYFSSLSNVEEVVKQRKVKTVRELYDHDIEKSRMEVYEKEENVIKLFRIVDTLVAIHKQYGNFAKFFDRFFISTSTKTPQHTSKVNLFDAKTTDLITLCLNNKLQATTEVMLWAVLMRLLYHPEYINNDDTSSEVMTDYLRIIMGWTREKNQRLVNDLKVNINLRLSDYSEANQIILTLAASTDLFKTLAATKQASLSAERIKGKFYGNYRFDIIRELSTCAELYYSFSLLIPSIEAASDAKSYIDRFYEFTALTDEKRIQSLNVYGYKGVCPMHDYYFYGEQDRWNYVFTVDSSDDEFQSALNAFTRWMEHDTEDTLNSSQLAYYINKYPDFINARYNLYYDRAPYHYFKLQNDKNFTAWALKSFSKQPIRGYNVDPYGYTVEQIYDGPYELEAVSEYSSHGLLWINGDMRLECCEKGWDIRFFDRRCKATKSFLSRFEEITNEKGLTTYVDTEGEFKFNGTIMLDLKGEDRIQTALRFLDVI